MIITMHSTQIYTFLHFFILSKNNIKKLIQRHNNSINNNYNTMERRLNKKLEDYLTDFKNNIRDKMETMDLHENEKGNQLLQYIYDYDRLTLDKEDFAKRKRFKNTISHMDRCSAKRATDEQCTRRKKEGCEFCGTHMKGTPHGLIEQHSGMIPTSEKVDVWAQEIKGIVYFIDKNSNVYKAEDVVANKDNPKIIAKYVKQGDIYSIPELGI